MFSNVTIEDYIAKAKLANKHPAKLLVISELLNQLFQVKVEELIPLIEFRLGSKLLGIKGSVDLIFSNVVLEIKIDLEKESEDASKQLIKYFQILQETKPEEKHIGMATDGIKFLAYAPVLTNGKVTNLQNISELNLETSSFDDAILWLDSFFFSKARKPTADGIKWRFGSSSPTYALTTGELKEMWTKVGHTRSAKLKLVHSPLKSLMNF